MTWLGFPLKPEWQREGARAMSQVRRKGVRGGGSPPLESSGERSFFFFSRGLMP